MTGGSRLLTRLVPSFHFLINGVTVKQKTCELCTRPWGDHTIANVARRLEWICPPPVKQSAPATSTA